MATNKGDPKSQLIEVHRAQSIIEREAILAALREVELDPISPERTMSRKVTENTLDLSLEGYSLMFDGFKILVPLHQERQGRQVVEEVLRRAAETERRFNHRDQAGLTAIEDAKSLSEAHSLMAQRSKRQRRKFWLRAMAWAYLAAFLYYLLGR